MTSLAPQSDADRLQRGSPAHLHEGRTSQRPGPRGRVAVLAHDDALRASICLLLDATGYSADGYALIEHFAPHTDEQRFDCIIVDADRATPNASRYAGRMPADLPVIMLMAEPDGALWASLGLSGPIHCLSKPVPPDELLNAVEHIIVSQPA